jgi:hypothetical protein
VRVVFLDIDGVLATDRTYREVERLGHVQYQSVGWGPPRKEWTRPDLLLSQEHVPAESVQALLAVCALADGFVLSSTWRNDPGLEPTVAYLRALGVQTPCLGGTPYRLQEVPCTFRNGYAESPSRYCTATRGDEIHAWLRLHPEVTHMVILDDDSELRPYGAYHVRTAESVGLRLRHVRKAQRILAQPFRLRSEESP